MNTQEMYQLVERYVKALEGGDPDAIEQFHAEDSVSESEGAPGKDMGKEQRRDYFKERVNAFSDVKMTANNITVDPKKEEVKFEWTIQATHSGNFKGLEPTNKRVEMTGRTELRIRDGKIVREKSHQNMGELLQQLRKG